MTKNIIYILIVMLIPLPQVFAQQLVKSSVNIHVSEGTNLTINGGITIDSGTFENNGNVNINNNPEAGPENIINNASNTGISGTGRFVLNSSELQEITGAYPGEFAILVINNTSSSGVNLGNYISVNDSLYLLSGNINTGTNYVEVLNPDVNAITGYNYGTNTPAYINGNLRRYIQQGTNTYDFPIGDNSNYYLNQIVFNDVSGVDYIDAAFIPLDNHNDIDLNVSESGINYQTIANEGVWLIKPNTTPTALDYDMRAYIGNINGLVDNMFSILKRPENSITAADWTCGNCGIGVGLENNDGEGRLASGDYALRKGLTDFSQFGIGKIGTDEVVLPEDTNICPGDSLIIYAGNFESYQWSTGDTTASIVVNSPGNYSVTVINTWSAVSSDEINVGYFNLPGIQVIDSTSISCFGNTDGVVTIEGVSGTAPYTYVWNNNGNSTSETATGLAPDTYYTVTVTDANNCSAKDSVLLTEPELLVVNDSAVSSTCNNNNGKAILETTGGTIPYTYNWDFSNDSISASLNNIYSGNYSYTVVDYRGCNAVGTIEVDDVSFDSLYISNTQDATCFSYNNGMAEVTAVGGVAPYTYEWNNSGNSTTAQVSNLYADQTYTVSVYDANNCMETIDVSVNQPDELLVDIEVLDSIACHGDNNAAVIANTTGGTQAYTYQWNVPGETNDQLNNISGNEWYHVSVTDLNMCEAKDSIFISQPNPMELLIDSIQNVICNGDSSGYASIITSGGNGNYNYQWSFGNTPSISETSGLNAGTHSVTVTDILNCSIDTMITINQPDAITIDFETTPTTCNEDNAQAIVSAVGGVPQYQYQWNIGVNNDTITNIASGSYTVTVVDDNLCAVIDSVEVGEIIPGTVSTIVNSPACYGDTTGSIEVIVENGQAPYTYNWDAVAEDTSIITNVSSGLYTVTVIDGNGCELDYVTSNITEPDSIILNLNANNLNCYGDSSGSIIANAQGGAGGFSYNWNTGMQTPEINGLNIGTYTVTVTDQNQCSKSGVASINQPESLAFVSFYDIQEPTCHGYADGEITAEVSGGTSANGFYDFRWQDEQGNTRFGTTGENLAAGTIYVTVTDDNGCTSEASSFMSQPDEIIISYDYTQASCMDGNDAEIQITGILGGQSPYLIKYMKPNEETNFTTAHDTVISNLSSGSYILKVEDANICSSETELIIPINDLPCVVASEIPTLFTPNGDNNHDDWGIKALELYPDASIEVYNRWGERVFYGNGADRWDGTYKGKDMPVGSYLFIINLNGIYEPIQGHVSIIR